MQGGSCVILKIDVQTYLLVIRRKNNNVVVNITGNQHPQVAFGVVDGSIRARICAGCVRRGRTDDRVGGVPALDALVVAELIQSCTVRGDEIMVCVRGIDRHVHHIQARCPDRLGYVLLRYVVPRFAVVSHDATRAVVLVCPSSAG